MQKIFSFEDYRPYINLKLLDYPQEGRGVKLQLSKFLNVQTTLISSIFSGKTLLQMDQALLMGQFFQLSSFETEYFLALVEMERAGSKNLRDFYYKKIKKMQLEQKEIDAALLFEKNHLDEKVRKIYYSNWSYVALHMLLATKKNITLESAAQSLGLRLDETYRRVDFLLTHCLLKKVGEEYHSGTHHIHLSRNHQEVLQHHANWRIKTIDHIARSGVENENNNEDLHYSVVMGISRQDAKWLREQLIHLVAKNSEMIHHSKEEMVQFFAFDFFEVGL